MRTFLKITVGFLVSFCFASVIAPAIGAPVTPVAGVLTVLSVLPTETGVAFTAISVTQLTTALGAYFRANKNLLFTRLMLPQNLNERFNVMDGIKDELPLPNLTISDLVKPQNDTTFQPTADALAFGARILKVRGWKVDLQIVPKVLEKTWLGQYSTPGSRYYKIPFEQMVMDHIIQKAQEEIRLMALYKGVYNGAGTTATDIMDGLLKIIADEITATNIAPVVTGAITSANVIDKLELTYDGLGEPYKGVPTIMKVNPTIYDWYNRKYRADFGANTNYDGMKKELYLDGTNCKVVKEPGLGSSQRVIVSQLENFCYGTDVLGEESNIGFQEFDRTVKVLIDAKAGVQIAQIGGGAISVNDQA